MKNKKKSVSAQLAVCHALPDAGTVEFTLNVSKDTPVINPAIVVKNWNPAGAKILLDEKENLDCKVGVNRRPDGDELILFILIKSEMPVKIVVIP